MAVATWWLTRFAIMSTVLPVGSLRPIVGRQSREVWMHVVSPEVVAVARTLYEAAPMFENLAWINSDPGGKPRPISFEDLEKKHRDAYQRALTVAGDALDTYRRVTGQTY